MIFLSLDSLLLFFLQRHMKKYSSFRVMITHKTFCLFIIYVHSLMVQINTRILWCHQLYSFYLHQLDNCAGKNWRKLHCWSHNHVSQIYSISAQQNPTLDVALRKENLQMNRRCKTTTERISNNQQGRKWFSAEWQVSVQSTTIVVPSYVTNYCCIPVLLEAWAVIQSSMICLWIRWAKSRS